MAKQLTITVKATDQASPDLRNVGRVILNVAGDTDKANAAANKWAASMEKTVGRVKAAIGILAVGVLAKSAVSAIVRQGQEIEAVDKTARRLGMSLRELSGLKYAAELTNGSFESLAEGAANFNRQIATFALTGSGKAREAIEKLGLNVREQGGRVKTFAELLPEVASGFERLSSPSVKELFSKQLFGGSGPEMMLLLNEGSARIREIGDEAERIGAIVTPEMAEAADQLGDSIDRVKAAWGGLKNIVVAEVGPTLAAVNNKIASVLSAAPTMIGNLGKVVRTALGDGPEAEQSKARLAAWGRSFVNLAKRVVFDVGVVILAGSREVINLLLGETETRLDTWLVSLPEKLSTKVLKAVYRTVQDAANLVTQHGTLAVASPFLAGLTGMGAASGVAADFLEGLEIQRDIQRQMEASQSQPTLLGLNIADYPRFKQVMGLVHADLAAAGGDFATATDQVVGYHAALAGRAFGNLPSRSGYEVAPKPDDDALVPKLAQQTNLTTGLRAGAMEFINSARDMESQGKGAVLNVANAFTSNLSTAIVDSISNIRNAKQAFKEFGAVTARAIANVVTQLLILRAVSGIAGSLAGSDYKLPAEYKAIGAPAAAGSAGDIVIKTGGLITPWGGVARRYRMGGLVAAAIPFAAGGVVPGPNINRDMVPAILAPGERVISRGGVKATDAAVWDYANRGGRVVPSGDGGTVINNHITINLNGSGAREQDIAAIRRAVTDGVGDALVRDMDRRPQLKDALRARLG